MTSDDVFTVLADPTRRRILDALRAGENSVGDLVQALEVSQPTVSKHLKVLREAGVVRMRADGQRRIYAVEPGALHHAATWLGGFPASEATAEQPAREEYKTPVPAGNAHSLDPAVPDAGSDATARALEAAASYRAAQQAQREQAAAAAMAPAARENPVVPGGTGHQQPLGRSVGRTVEQVTGRAQDLLERLQKPKFGRRR